MTTNPKTPLTPDLNPEATPNRKQRRHAVAYRRGKDRHILSRRLMGLRDLVQSCDWPLVGQAWRATQQAYLELRGAEQRHREASKDRALRSRDQESIRQQAALLPAYVARKVIEAPVDDWQVPGPSALDASARQNRLLGGHAPSELAKNPQELRLALESLSKVLREDPAEAGRWKESFVQAVHRMVKELDRADAALSEARNRHRDTRLQLGKAQAWWDCNWTAAEAVIAGYYRHIGQEVEIARVFAPVRYRMVTDDGAAPPPDEGGGNGSPAETIDGDPEEDDEQALLLEDGDV